MALLVTKGIMKTPLLFMFMSLVTNGLLLRKHDVVENVGYFVATGVMCLVFSFNLVRAIRVYVRRFRRRNHDGNNTTMRCEYTRLVWNNDDMKVLCCDEPVMHVLTHNVVDRQHPQEDTHLRHRSGLCSKHYYRVEKQPGWHVHDDDEITTTGEFEEDDGSEGEAEVRSGGK